MDVFQLAFPKLPSLIMATRLDDRIFAVEKTSQRLNFRDDMIVFEVRLTRKLKFYLKVKVE